MSKQPKSARKNEIFVTRAAACRTWEKGAKGRSAALFSLLHSLFLGQLQGWVTHVLSASTPFVGTQTPTLQILICSPEERTRRKRVSYQGMLSPRQAFRFRSSPNWISPETARFFSGRDPVKSFQGLFLFHSFKEKISDRKDERKNKVSSMSF